MHRAEKRYIGAVLLEGLVLVINCVLSIVWLLRCEAEQNMDQIKWIILVTVLISCIVIPIESVIFHLCKKHNAGEERAVPSGSTKQILSKLRSAFVVLWFVHAIVFQIMVSRYHWRHGSDQYMYYLRPGSIIILLSVVGIEIADHTVNRKTK